MLQNLTLFVKKIVPLFFHELSIPSRGRVSSHRQEPIQDDVDQPDHLIVSRALFNFSRRSLKKSWTKIKYFAC
jgi:hypothetical protein